MNNTKRIIGLIPILGWPILGFKRGLNSYDYNYSNNKLYKYSENPKHPLFLIFFIFIKFYSILLFNSSKPFYNSVFGFCFD